MKTKFFDRVKWLKRNVKLLVLLLMVLFLLFISCTTGDDGSGAQLAMALVTGVAGGTLWILLVNILINNLASCERENNKKTIRWNVAKIGRAHV